MTVGAGTGDRAAASSSFPSDARPSRPRERHLVAEAAHHDPRGAADRSAAAPRGRSPPRCRRPRCEAPRSRGRAGRAGVPADLTDAVMAPAAARSRCRRRRWRRSRRRCSRSPRPSTEPRSTSTSVDLRPGPERMGRALSRATIERYSDVGSAKRGGARRLRRVVGMNVAPRVGARRSHRLRARSGRMLRRGAVLPRHGGRDHPGRARQPFLGVSRSRARRPILRRGRRRPGRGSRGT